MAKQDSLGGKTVCQDTVWCDAAAVKQLCAERNRTRTTDSHGKPVCNRSEPGTERCETDLAYSAGDSGASAGQTISLKGGTGRCGRGVELSVMPQQHFSVRAQMSRTVSEFR